MANSDDEETGTWDPADMMAELENTRGEDFDPSVIPAWAYPVDPPLPTDMPILAKFPLYDQKKLALKTDLYTAAGAPWNKVESVAARLDWYEAGCTAETWAHTDVQLQMSVGIAYVTLNRPDFNNTLNDTIIHGLMDAVFILHKRPDIRIVVFNANGKMFSAGADPQAMKAQRDGTCPVGEDGSPGRNPVRMKEQSKKVNNALKIIGESALQAGAFPDGEVNLTQLKEALLWQTLTRLPQVTLALVEGSCMGTGMIIPACVDMTIALESVFFSMEDLMMGLVPAIMMPHIVQKMGPSKARFMLLSGSLMGGQDAKDCTMVQELAKDSKEAHGKIAEVCELEQKCGPVSVASCKELCNGVAGNPITEKLMFFTAYYLARVTAGAESASSMKCLQNKVPKPWEAEDVIIKPLYDAVAPR